MAGEEHLKVAAANIRRAVLEKRNEVRALQELINKRHADIDHEINHLDHDRTLKEAAAIAAPVATAKAALLKEVRDNKKTIEEKQKEIRQFEDEIRRQITNAEGQIRELEQRAGDFERAWGV